MYRSVYQASLTALVAERDDGVAQPLSPAAKRREFQRFYDRLSAKVALYVRMRGFADTAADEIVQKIFEIAWRGFDEGAWAEGKWDLRIFRVAEKTCRQEMKKVRKPYFRLLAGDKGRKNRHPTKAGQNAGTPQAFGDKFYACLEAWIPLLPGKQREVFVMRMNDFSYEQIGYALKITAETARKYMLSAIDAGYAVFADFPELFS